MERAERMGKREELLREMAVVRGERRGRKRGGVFELLKQVRELEAALREERRMRGLEKEMAMASSITTSPSASSSSTPPTPHTTSSSSSPSSSSSFPRPRWLQALWSGPDVLPAWLDPCDIPRDLGVFDVLQVDGLEENHDQGGLMLRGGCNGAVIKVKLMPSEAGEKTVGEGSTELALKLVYNLGDMSRTTAAASAASEHEVLSSIPRHRNIVQLYWADMIPPPLSIVHQLPLDKEVRALCAPIHPTTKVPTPSPFLTILLEYVPWTLPHFLARFTNNKPVPGSDDEGGGEGGDEKGDGGEHGEGFFPPFSILLSVCSQLSIAVAHLFVNRVLHLDLKPDNIMVTKEGVVKLVDFGCAKKFHLPGKGGGEGGGGEGRGGGGGGGGGGGSATTPSSAPSSSQGVCTSLTPAMISLETATVLLSKPTPFEVSYGELLVAGQAPFGNPAHAAPEVIDAFTKASKARDFTASIDYTHQPVFALGVLFFEICTGSHPYPSYPPASPSASPTPLPLFLPSQFSELLTAMVQLTPERRPTLFKVVEKLYEMRL